MTNQPFPYPRTKPLERLYVHDGLMMNAERWQLAHHYHRQRQSIHYQSLYQPGIIYGLGVKVIEPPQNSLLRYRAIDEQRQERRWLEIQPGIAIDAEGNPIVVDAETDRTYRIAIDPPTTGGCTVYIVVSYVDPPEASDSRPTRLTVPERFRFDQKVIPPNEREVELCRIELAPGSIALKHPSDVLAPGINEINLLHRVQAQIRSLTYLRVGILAPAREDAYENCSYLIRSLPALYPSLQGELYSAVPSASAQAPSQTPSRYVRLSDQSQCNSCDLLYADAEFLSELGSNSEAIETLRRYFKTGGVLLLNTPDDSTSDQQVDFALQALQLVSEPIVNQVRTGWSTLNDGLSLPPEHSIKVQPFVFIAPPILREKPIQIAASDEVIWVGGPLSDAWGIRGDFSRDEIRTAQELGINILYFAQRRRNLIQLLQWTD